MTELPWPNLAAMFFNQVNRHGDEPFLWAKRDGTYRPLSWRDTAARVTPLARSLRALGISAGDRVVLVCESRPAWMVSDMAIMAIGAITVPAYTTNTVDDHLHILTDSGAKAAIVSTHRLAERLVRAAVEAPELKTVVSLEPLEGEAPAGLEIVHMDQLIDRGRTDHENIVETAQRWPADNTACIIYTSGTGGLPKGVMLSHRNLFHNLAGAADALMELGLGNEVFLSFLPLSHSYEHMAGHLFPVSIGAQIYYAEGVEALATNMTEARPTIMTAVPRLYETMHQRISQGVRKSGGAKEKLFMKTVELGRRRFENPADLGVIERIQDRVLDKLVRDKVRARFGGRLKALVSGGAPLNPDIGLFFTALGMRLLQGYGQTETAPLISVNRPSNVKLHSVGPPVKDTEVKIASDGEILARGDLVMQGYWRNEQETAETIRDGWVHTGDIGYIDDDGHLIITDRKKDIIVNSGGDNIAPQRVEGLLTLEPEIAQALVFGDQRPHLVALLVPDPVWLTEWAKNAGNLPELAAVADDATLHKALALVVERANTRFSKIENIRRFMIASEPFTIDNEQMTPTMKVRRHKVLDIYGNALIALYR